MDGSAFGRRAGRLCGCLHGRGTEPACVERAPVAVDVLVADVDEPVLGTASIADRQVDALGTRVEDTVARAKCDAATWYRRRCYVGPNDDRYGHYAWWMQVRRLRKIAEGSGSALSESDEAVVLGLIEEAYGTERLRLEVVGVGPSFPRLALADGPHGLVLSFGARLRLRTTGEIVGYMLRRVFFDQHIAVHVSHEIDPAHRDDRHGTELLDSAVRAYDAWQIMRIELRAGFDLGRWHWARVGFDFARVEEQDAAIKHTRHVISALGTDVAVDDDASAQDLEALASPIPASLREVAAVSERFDHKPVLLAARNGINIDAPMRLGKAILLCGPTWAAACRLNGTQRARLDAYIARRLGS